MFFGTPGYVGGGGGVGGEGGGLNYCIPRTNVLGGGGGDTMV